MITRTYVETSALLLACLQRNAPMRKALANAQWPITSSLTAIEAIRAPRRRLAHGDITAAQAAAAIAAAQAYLSRCELIGLTRRVRELATHGFPDDNLRTGDAIQIASVQIAAELASVEVLVTDERVLRNCKALGFKVVTVGK